MYYLIPYRQSLPSHWSVSQVKESLKNLAQTDAIQVKGQSSSFARMVRTEEQYEWLAPEISLDPAEETEPANLQLLLRPKRWLKRLLRMEMGFLIALLVWLGIRQLLTPFVLVLGLVFINHLFIFLMMRRRFQATGQWFREQLVPGTRQH